MGILQARILEWVAMPFPRDLPNPGIEPRSPALQVDTLPPEPQGSPLVNNNEADLIDSIISTKYKNASSFQM